MMGTIFNQLINSQYLVQVQIKTGGGYQGVRFPTRSAYRGNPAAFAQLFLSNQFKLSRTIGGNAALQQIQAYYDLKAAEGHDWPGNRPTTMNACNINMANFVWRYTHKIGSAFRKIRSTVEISHHAESYSVAHPEWGECKVEVTQLESAPVNESRKNCTRFGLMWLKPNGELIGLEEEYSGPTQCPHANCNSPCYAPYPTLRKEPTGFTPNPRKHGKGGRGSGAEGGGKKRKVETPLKADAK